MESESQKKSSYCVLGDVYGVVMLPKELDHLDKHHSFDLPRLQFPDLAKPFQAPDSSSVWTTILFFQNSCRPHVVLDDYIATIVFLLLSMPLLLPKDILRTREVGEFLSGALAGAMTKAVLAPLETIRISNACISVVLNPYLSGKVERTWRKVIVSARKFGEARADGMNIMQLSLTRMVVGIGSKSIAGSFAEVIEHQGLQGLWAGNTVNMLRIVPTQAIEFGTFEYVKRAMSSAQERWNQTDCPMVQIGHVNLKFSLSWISPIAVAGAAAGVVSTLVCHPLEVLKDRLTISPEAYPSIAVGVSRIYKDGGLGAFYAGLAPTLIGILPYSTCYYFMYEKLKKSYCLAFKKKSLSRADMLLVGALSGFTAGTISFPLEVARKRLMVGALEGKCPPNMAAALAEVIRERGLLGLYRGWGASCLKVAPSSGITWMFYEAWKDVLLLERRQL
ncbi:hypothetical protein RHSIM_Rhsim08G0250800 [Rhododendron simsii]|uniref:Mitochondrial adenine nucleotide transporter BTL1 n=1 Tax=Rhododendron simsii TaxID=118357 RepID=A0A834GMN5_RHOSS|nr:hypothetical protein RHSIM_Rhsim08G0250800 [Rhododendron simsii]